MKGNNELHLNVATMVEAVQEYLDKRMTTFAPKVTNVSLHRDHFNIFEIATTDKEPETS